MSSKSDMFICWTSTASNKIYSWFSDEVAKNFWANQFPTLINKFSIQAKQQSDSNSENVEERVEKYKNEYNKKVTQLINKWVF